ncbi:MAG: hypothetical protein A3F16_06140 [Deltaproteobacteria bacterium RIFCSPHIGHO2_12_FULL_43_9]|nr:MAG: hypothetical protein A3F16_06140 [Deltaproteobacteria bacterium RIFCSPHIGHO2_12_FULL_43_9]
MSDRELKNRQKQSNIETANEMYKFAFDVKKEQFSKQYPNLLEEELVQMTSQFLRESNEKKK